MANGERTANPKQQTAKADTAVGSRRDPFGDAYSFRNLAMWQRAQELTDQILDIVARLPNTRVAGIVLQQIVRSSSSIAANIAEGHGRFAAGAYRNHLSIARGSTTETISWLDLLRRRGWITPEEEHATLSKCAEIMRVVTAKINDLGQAPRTGSRLNDEGEPYSAD